MILFLAALSILHQNDLKTRMNRINATWLNGRLEQIDDHPVHPPPNHHPPKMDVLPKTFLQSILTAKWLVGVSGSDDLCFLFCLIIILLVEGSITAADPDWYDCSPAFVRG